MVNRALPFSLGSGLVYPGAIRHGLESDPGVAWLLAEAPLPPRYWHYDILQVLLVLSRFGKLPDPRASEAVEQILEKR